MRTNRKLLIAAPIAALVLGGGIYAVHSSTDDAGTVEATPTITASPEASEPAVVDVAPGEILTEEPAALPDDYVAFPLSDGTFAAVAQGEPLPETVRAAVVEAYAASVPALTDPNSNEQLSALSNAFTGYLREQEAATGKKLVVIHHLYGYTLESDTVPVWSYFIGSAHGDGNLAMDNPNRDAAIAAAQAWIDTKRDPGEWDIIVID